MMYFIVIIIIIFNTLMFDILVSRVSLLKYQTNSRGWLHTKPINIKTNISPKM